MPQAAKRPRPDAVTFNAAAAACAKAGDYQKAEQVLKQARRFNKLDAILYTSVISALVWTSRPNEQGFILLRSSTERI